MEINKNLILGSINYYKCNPLSLFKNKTLSEKGADNKFAKHLVSFTDEKVLNMEEEIQLSFVLGMFNFLDKRYNKAYIHFRRAYANFKKINVSYIDKTLRNGTKLNRYIKEYLRMYLNISEFFNNAGYEVEFYNNFERDLDNSITKFKNTENCSEYMCLLITVKRMIFERKSLQNLSQNLHYNKIIHGARNGRIPSAEIAEKEKSVKIEVKSKKDNSEGIQKEEKPVVKIKKSKVSDGLGVVIAKNAKKKMETYRVKNNKQLKKLIDEALSSGATVEIRQIIEVKNDKFPCCGECYCNIL